MEQKLKNSKKSLLVDSLIFDLDGVITQTRDVHKKAWQEMFDLFFEKQKDKYSEQASMSENDYLQYVDGKPRYQGVKSFLDSRNIELPWGNTDDNPGFETVCSLGNMKNELFNKILDRDGVEVYDDALQKLEEWKHQGIKTAIVSSSKNCKKIIEVAGMDHLFDTRVDGTVSEATGLKGKPNPDIFTEAARLLDARAEKSVVFEDAISGVQAGQRGYFGLVVGVNRFDNKDALLKNGADITVDSFFELDLTDEELVEEYLSHPGKPIFPGNNEIFEILSRKEPVIFLDYDGTLSPIVTRPEDAIISNEMKDTLKSLASKFTVAIVTGRDKEDVENLVGLEELIYAGSHGYIISGPNNLFMEHPDSKKIIPKLDEIQEEVEKELKEKTEGTQIDRKRYAIGIHYRNARPEDEKVVYDIANKILDKHKGHKIGEGKKIVEIKPDLDWHKGKAVEWILGALELTGKDHVAPVFIGDDVTDEDAFKILQDKGIGIMVGSHGQKTYATYSLKNVFQVREFFNNLIELYNSK